MKPMKAKKNIDWVQFWFSGGINQTKKKERKENEEKEKEKEKKKTQQKNRIE